MLKNLSYYTASLIVTSIISILTVPIFTRYLTVSDYGILAIYGLFGGTLINILSIGMTSASIMFYHKLDSKDFNSLNFTNVVFMLSLFSFGGYLLTFIDDFIVKEIFDNKISKDVIYYSYYYAILFKIYSHFNVQFIHQKRAKLHFIFSLTFTGIFTIVSLVLLIYFSQGLYSRIFGGFVVLFILTPFMIFSQRKFLSLLFSLKKLKRSLLYSYPYLPGSIVNTVNDSFDKTMLTNFKGTTDVGYYQIAQQVSAINSQFINILQTVFAPFFLENSQNLDKEKTRLIVDRYHEIIVLFNFVCFGTCLFGHEMIIILTTKEFYFAAQLIPIIIASSFFAFITGTISKPQLMISEKLIYSFYSSLVFVIINVSLNIYLIPLYSAIGALIALLVATIISSIMTLYFSQKFFYMPISYKKIFLNYSLFLVSLVPIYILMNSSLFFWQIILLKILLIFIYLIISIKLSLIEVSRIKYYFSVILKLKFL